MKLFHKAQKSSFPAVFGHSLLALASLSSAYGPDGEAVLEALRDRIAQGRGGEQAYRDMAGVLAENPGWECGEEAPIAAGRNADAALREALAARCPEAAETGGRDGEARFRASASQTVRPREGGRADARWRLAAAGAGAGMHAGGAGTILRDRALRVGSPCLEAFAGHFAPGLERERVGLVLGRAAYAGGGASGIGGPLEARRAALDGLALAWRPGPWGLHAAGAWNRLRPLGNREDAPRIDAGLLAAGAAWRPGRGGTEARLQGMLLRLEPGAAPAAWLAAAGMEARGRAGPWAWEAGAAGSRSAARASVDRWGGSFEARWALPAPARGKAAPEETWEVRARQATPGWANPLAARDGILRDTLAGMVTAGGGGEGGLDAAARLPLAASGGWSAELPAGGGLAWILPGTGEAVLARGEGRAALVQAWGDWAWSSGLGIGWRPEDGSRPAPGGWGHTLEWRGEGWRARARWSRPTGDSRREPLSLGGGREGRWGLEASVADARRPWRRLRLEGKRVWRGGKGIRVEQRLALPVSPGGIAAGLAYQLALRAEF